MKTHLTLPVSNHNRQSMHFEWTSWFDAPVESVWAFHELPDAIERLTPPGQHLRVVSRKGGIEEGAVVDFRIRVGPVPVRWLARHTTYEKYRLFTDEQVKGPFRRWVHQHRFSEEHGGTRLTDSIELNLPGGAVAEALAGWIVKQQLEQLFRYRHKVTRDAVEG